ncbi:MAG: DUF4166 domain-containing protein [Gammaproteobacteria bacterium]
MQYIPLLQKTLGADWEALPAVIRKHYTVGPTASTCVQGVMIVGYPGFLRPMIKAIHLSGGLIARRGQDVKTRVEKTVSSQHGGLCWRRTLEYSDGKQDFFHSCMVYRKPHELTETIRFGFGLRLNVTVEQGTLVYRSNGHLWQCGRFELNIPDWLLLGKATIIESPVSDRQFSLDFKIRHPIWGDSYYYRGVFEYCE